MEAVWRRLEAALPERHRAALRPGASEAALLAAEATLGRRLPDELRASFALHDGQTGPGLLDGAALLTLDQAVRLRAALLKEPALWPPGWLPVTTRGTGDHHVVSLADGALVLHGRGPLADWSSWSDLWLNVAGEPVQFDVAHDRFVGPRVERRWVEERAAPPATFRGLLEEAAAALEGGAWVDDDLLGVVSARWRRWLLEGEARCTEARDLVERRRRLRERLTIHLKSLAKSKKLRCDPYLLTRAYARAAVGKPPEAIADLEAYIESRTSRVTVTSDGVTVEHVIRPPEHPGLQVLIATLRHAPDLAALPPAQ